MLVSDLVDNLRKKLKGANLMALRRKIAIYYFIFLMSQRHDLNLFFF